MESGRITTQRWPSFSSLATFTAAAMAVPELPPVTQRSSMRAETWTADYESTSRNMKTHRTAGLRLWSACATYWRTPHHWTCTKNQLPAAVCTYVIRRGSFRNAQGRRKTSLKLTDLSSTVGMKSYPMPSTSYWVLSVLLISSGSARMEPSGSTPTICTQHPPFISKQQLSAELFHFL